MHHILAWRKSIADIVADDITPVTDGLMAINNSHFVPQNDMRILAAYFGGAGATRARFITPSFRQTSTPWIRPINLAIVPLDEPNIADYTANPLKIKGLEELQLEGYQTTGGAAVVVGVAAVSPGPIAPAPQGDIISMRGTGTTTVTAGAWTQCTITWQDTLPAGRYSVVGLSAIGATALAGRLILEESFWRPGCVGSGLVSSSNSPIFIKGGLGNWGEFTGNRMPSVEFLCNAADTAQEVYLDFVRIG